MSTAAAASSPTIGLAPSPLLDERDAARLLAFSVFALRRWRVDGRGPHFVQVGRNIRYRLDDLVSWTDARVRR